MYSFAQLTQTPPDLEILAYYPLTFPRFCPLLQGLSSGLQTVAIEARHGEEVVGLALAARSRDGLTAHVLSIYAKEKHRRQGIGSGLLATLEETLCRQACRYVYLLYREDITSAGALRKIVAHNGWSRPEVALVMVKGLAAEIRGAEWVDRKRPLPEGFEIFLWSELSNTEREVILQRQQAGPWYPETLSPFKEEAIIEPLNSLGLRYQGEVVGWMVNHRIGPDTIRYTPLFVSEEVRNSSAGYMLIAEAIRLHLTSGVLNYLFLFEPDSPIRKWVLRRFGEHAVIRNILKSYKHLNYT